MQKAGHAILKDMVYAKYKNEAAMASYLGWPRQRLNKITTGRRIPTVQEVGELSVALGEGVGTVAALFLPNKSPNERQKNDRPEGRREGAENEAESICEAVL